MKRLLLPLLSVGALAFACVPSQAQQESRELVPTASKRAINLARGTAAKSNGGLRLYHPAPLGMLPSVEGRIQDEDW